MAEGGNSDSEQRDISSDSDQSSDDVRSALKQNDQSDQNANPLDDRDDDLVSARHSNDSDIMNRALDVLVGRVNEAKDKLNENVETIDEHAEIAIAEIRKVRGEIKELFDELEVHMGERVEKIKREDKQRIIDVEAECSVIENEIRDITNAIQNKTEDATRDDVAVVLDKISACEKRLSSMSSKVNIRQYTFTLSQNLKYLLQSQKELGKLYFHDFHATPSSKMYRVKSRQGSMDSDQILAESPVTLTFTKQLNVRIKEDKDTCSIRGSDILPDGRLVVTDWENQSIKVINVDDDVVDLEISLPSEPWDITHIRNDIVAVTLPFKEKIQFVHVDQQLPLLNEIQSNGQCRGLVHSKDRLIVSYCCSAKLEILSMTGGLFKVLSRDPADQQLFTCPSYLAVSPDHTSVYVSDFLRGTLTFLTLDGNVKAVYQDSDLQGPVGVDFDSKGRIYVCALNTNTIHILNAELEKISVISNQRHLSDLYTIKCHGKQGILYVGMDRSDSTKQFRIA